MQMLFSSRWKILPKNIMNNENESSLHESEILSEHNSEESVPKPLARLSVREENMLKIQSDLEQIFTENLLARVDVGNLQAEELTALGMELPSLAYIQETSTQLSVDFSSPEEIEQLLFHDRLGDLVIDGKSLKELFDEGMTGSEQRKMIKRGITFLKLKRYNEAVDWWLLNRLEKAPPNSRLYLILTLFLAITYKLSGNESEAASALREAKNNRLF
jgi:hypothetical protein